MQMAGTKSAVQCQNQSTTTYRSLELLQGMPTDAVLTLGLFDAKPSYWILVNVGNGVVGKAHGLRGELLGWRERARNDLEGMDFDHIFVTEEPTGKSDYAILALVDMVGSTTTGTGKPVSFMSPDDPLHISNKPIEVSASVQIFKLIILRGFWSHQQ